MLSVKRVKTTCGGYRNFCIPEIEISVVKFVTRTNKIDDEVQPLVQVCKRSMIFDLSFSSLR